MDGWSGVVGSGWVLVLGLSLNSQLRDVVVGIVTNHLDFLAFLCERGRGTSTTLSGLPPSLSGGHCGGHCGGH